MSALLPSRTSAALRSARAGVESDVAPATPAI
jgi:hypothetical protein